MKRFNVYFAFTLLSAVLTGCQTVGNGRALEAAPVGPQTVDATGKIASPVVPGVSTKADVAREWGTASVTTFPSGYEVWVYQQTVGVPKLLNYLPIVQWFTTNIEDRTAEVALLFAPNGVLKKMEHRDGRAQTVAAKSLPAQTAKSSPE